MIFRFAPSPTGLMHLGGLRTMLYNVILAKKYEGKFILRIDDTDRSRYSQDAYYDIVSTVEKFTGTTVEPVIQSQRTKLYQRYAFDMVTKNQAYYCVCSPERLENLRLAQSKQSAIPSYDRLCRDKQCTQGIVRLKAPFQKLKGHDIIRGQVTGPVDDCVLVKDDGHPTYHLASAVDDHELGVSVVVRGEEWLNSLPKHAYLNQMLNSNVKYLHLPLLVNKDGTKLSKRDGAIGIQSLSGYYTQAITYYLLTLGLTDQYVRKFIPLQYARSQSEYLDTFAQLFPSLEQLPKLMSKNSITIDLKRLDMINRKFMSLQLDQDPGTFYQQVVSLDSKLSRHEQSYVVEASKLILPQVVTVKDIPVVGSYLFDEPDLQTDEAQQMFNELSIDSEDAFNLLKQFKQEGYNVQQSDTKTKALLRWRLTGCRKGAKLQDFIPILQKHGMLEQRLKMH